VTTNQIEKLGVGASRLGMYILTAWEELWRRETKSREDHTDEGRNNNAVKIESNMVEETTEEEDKKLGIRADIGHEGEGCKEGIKLKVGIIMDRGGNMANIGISAGEEER
jgi:hypothetical protein